MSWFVRFTRFGDMHWVYAQEAKKSCGIACVMMTVFKVNKLAPGKAALYKEKQIDDVYSHFSHQHYDGTTSSHAQVLAKTLNHLHVGHWRAEYHPPASVSKIIKQNVGEEIVGATPIVNTFLHKKPVIVLVGWKPEGGHFVVVDTVNRFAGHHYASVCDPWDGNVHVTRFHPGHSFHYVGHHVPYSWDLGGTKHEYQHKDHGAGNGWVIRLVGKK